MELSEVLRVLNPDYDPNLIELLSPHWEYSQRDEPRDWQLLQRAYWQECRAWCDCGPEVDEALEEVAAQVASNSALHSLAWHCRRLLFENEDYNRFREWPALLPLLGEIRPAHQSAFFLLLAIGAAPRLRERNAQRDVPEKITRDTLGDIGIAVRRFARYNHGAIGIEPRLLNWHRLVSSGDLYRVGRLEFHARPFSARLRVYRHRANQRVLALSEPDVAYDADGQLSRVHAASRVSSPNPTGAWTSKLEETSATICGHPISPRGFALERTTEIQTDEWEPVLARGDMVLIVHIPEGESVTLENSHASFEQAHEFFSQRFPEYSLRAFATNSWMFNTQFETMLAPSSKMLAWQRELYLYPENYSGNDGLYFVFNRDHIELATAPRDTTLRRAMIEHLQAGKLLRSGGMFFLFDDLPRYGTQIYRKMHPDLDSC